MRSFCRPVMRAACGGRGGTGLRAAIDLFDGYFTGNETAGIDAVHQFVGTARKWAQKVLETAERTTRCNTERQMTEKGFNIAVEAKKLEVFYQSLLR